MDAGGRGCATAHRTPERSATRARHEPHPPQPRSHRHGIWGPDAVAPSAAAVERSQAWAPAIFDCRGNCKKEETAPTLNRFPPVARCRLTSRLGASCLVVLENRFARDFQRIARDLTALVDPCGPVPEPMGLFVFYPFPPRCQWPGFFVSLCVAHRRGAGAETSEKLGVARVRPPCCDPPFQIPPPRPPAHRICPQGGQKNRRDHGCAPVLPRKSRGIRGARVYP